MSEQETDTRLPAIRRDTTGEHPACPGSQLVYRKMPPELSTETGDVFLLQEEVRKAIKDCFDIVGRYPAVIYLPDAHAAQMYQAGFAVYYVHLEQGYRAIPLRKRTMPDSLIVCVAG